MKSTNNSTRTELFIPGNVPSLKNSKIKTSRGVFASKTVKKYLQKQGIVKYSVRDKAVTNYKTRDNEFAKHEKFFIRNLQLGGPHQIGFHFVRGSKHKFDFHNAVQIIADLMVAHNFIEDDNMDHFIPRAYKRKNKWYSYDKTDPGVWIKIYK